MKHWKTVGHKTLFENSWIRLNLFDVILPNGKSGTYSVIEPKSQAVTIVAIDQRGQVALIEEERFPLIKDELHTAPSYTLRLPMGGAGHEDDTPLKAAQEELREETGLVAKRWEHIGLCAPLSGLSSEKAMIYVATGLLQTNATSATDEGINDKITYVPLDRVAQVMMQRGVVDGQSLAAIAMTETWLQKNNFRLEG